ncbi:DUF115 domain-containing protein [Granulosicoccaceae sp. 1_MG-2023]|nr:DUF115 domain-containing protein [Granulosicoccaceae sp. 1_MG-2023]
MHKDFDANDLRFRANAHGDLYLPEVVSEAVARHEYADLWQTRYAPIDFKRSNNYVFCGTDSGLLIKAFAAAAQHRDLALWFVEDERIIAQVRRECAAQLAQLPHALLLSGDELQALLDSGQLDNSVLAGRVNMLRAACAEHDESGWYTPMFAKLHQRIDARHTLINSLGSRLPFIAQTLLNLPSTQVPASIVKDRFAGMTVCLLAAGPSLDEHLDWLRLHRDEVVVIAVSRISRRLREAGIIPDFVVSIDPQEISFDVSREGLQMQPTPVLAFANQTISRLVNQWQGPKIYFGPRLPWHKRDDETPVASLTVTNQAFEFAVAGRPEQIILMGTDFCLDAAGHTHAQGNPEREQGISLRADMEEVVTYDGSVRLSSYDYYNSGKQLEIQIAAVHESIRVINPSAGAMRLNNVIHTTLEDTQSSIAPVQQQLQSLRRDIQAATGKPGYMRHSCEELRLFRKRSADLRKLAEEALKLTGVAAEDSPRGNKANRRLFRIDKQIRKDYARERQFCTDYFPAYFSDVFQTGADLADNTPLAFGDALDKSRHIYEAYCRILEGVDSVAKHTLKIIKLWPDDPAEAPADKFCQLMLTLDWPAVLLRNESRVAPEWLEQARQQHEAQFKRRSVRLEQVLETLTVNEASLFKVLSSAYNQRSLDKLAHFKNALTQMNDFPSRELYYRLSDAYHAEIIGNTDLAMDSYRWIIDQGQTNLLEESLNRVAFLCIRTGDSETALMALSVLSEINPMYEATLEQFRLVA